MIYLASPYTDDDYKVMQRRYELTRDFCAKATKHGHSIISPICHWHPIAVSNSLPGDYKFWWEWNLQILRVCIALWVLKLEGFSRSEGVKKEIFAAEVLGIPTAYVEFMEFD